MNWPAAFALTCAVELPIVVAIAPASLRRRTVLDVLAVNLLTHPLAWSAAAVDLLPWTAIEIVVVLLEWLAYAKVTGMPWRRAAIAAVLANAITAALSFFV